jgi:septation ring formation regulator EzrA
MTAMETTMNELGHMLSYVVEHMVTKDEVHEIVRDEISGAYLATKADIAALGEQVASIEGDLKSIRRDLNDLADKVDNISGYRREIDHALERIAEIESHLGIAKRSTA